MKFELAPAAIIRAPAWPIETLDVFGDADLADACRTPGSGSIDRAYEATIDRERNSLWERTAGDARFMKALLLASPSLFDRVRTHPGPRSQRSKNSRHIETALYRYLARAAARPTPNQLWAGVALAPFGTHERIVAAAPRVQFGPDLVPFAFALGVLCRRGIYREAGNWRISPTLRRHADGAWRFLARLFNGRVELRQIGSDSALDNCLLRLRDAGTGTLRDLSVRANAPLEILGQLSEAGVLIGGLCFPTRFTSPWEALQLAGNALLGDDRVAWERARSLLAGLSETLAGDLDRMAFDNMIAVIEHARRAMAELFAALDVEVEVPATPFRCDLKLPFEITLGAETRQRLLDNLGAYQREWIDHLSPSSSNRREKRRAIVNALSNAPAPIGSQLSDIPLRQNTDLDAWATTFWSSEEHVILDGEKPHDPICSAPWGTFIARFGESGLARVVGIDDSPMRLFARHCNLLGLGNPAERWVQDLFSRVETDCKVKAGDLAIPFESNPNILARPSVARLLVEPWGPDGITLNEAELHAESGAILLHTPADGWVAAVSCASAHWLAGDPVAADLALSGFGEPMGPNLPATSQAAPDEGGIPRYAARLVLSSGATIRPRRTCLAGASAEDLTRLARKARYTQWRKLVRQLGWPDRVSLSFDGGPPLTIQSSSPLAIEAAFQGAWRAREIVVEESVSGWLRGAGGNHVAEIVVPFSRSPHAFSALMK